MASVFGRRGDVADQRLRLRSDDGFNSRELANMLLARKTCLITGGGTGIGRAIAFRLVEEGAAA